MKKVRIKKSKLPDNVLKLVNHNYSYEEHLLHDFDSLLLQFEEMEGIYGDILYQHLVEARAIFLLVYQIPDPELS